MDEGFRSLIVLIHCTGLIELFTSAHVAPLISVVALQTFILMGVRVTGLAARGVGRSLGRDMKLLLHRLSAKSIAPSFNLLDECPKIAFLAIEMECAQWALGTWGCSRLLQMTVEAARLYVTAQDRLGNPGSWAGCQGRETQDAGDAAVKGLHGGCFASTLRRLCWFRLEPRSAHHKFSQSQPMHRSLGVSEWLAPFPMPIMS